MEIAVDESRIVIPNEERTIIKTRFGTVETIITTTVDELNNYIFDKYFPRELNKVNPTKKTMENIAYELGAVVSLTPL